MKILILYNQSSGCCYHRSYLPFSCMQIQDGDQTLFKDYQDVLMDEDFQVDIVYYNRIPPIPINNLNQLRKRYGFKICCDIDDYFFLYPGHYLEKIWEKDRMSEHVIANLRNADLVTCTNYLLREDVLNHNRNCEVIPNGLPFDILQFNSFRVPDSKARVTFAGGGSHYHDLKSIEPALNKLSMEKDVKDNSVFNLAGFEPTEVWKNIERLFTGLPVMKNKYMPLMEYMNQYMFADISIAPLCNNYFNMRKSNLKIIEAGCKAIPIVCTDMHPYIDKNEGVIKCNTQQDWYKEIKSLILSPAKRTELGSILAEYVRNRYDLLKINKDRYEILTNLIK